MPLYAEAWNRADKITGAGGSALNMARAQMHSNPAGKVMYLGCIGEDEFGQALTDAVSNAGVEARFQKTSEEPTGTCVSVIVGKERSLCANIAAAKKFSMDHLNANMVSSPNSIFVLSKFLSVIFL